MRKPIIAGNWKMHKTVSEAAAFLREVKDKIRGEDVETVVCAPFTALFSLCKEAEGSLVRIGAQNVHWEDSGAFTGEISGPMLKELGVRYVIIGHSERRAYFAESDETVNKKVHAAFRSGLIPIVCVGETLEEREAGQTMEVCARQTVLALQGLSAEQAEQTVIAYEPIWAIGTGKSSTSEDANEVIRSVRRTVAEQFGQRAADRIRIQYGGSVKPENIGEFMAQSDIDGALVGGASLEPSSFLKLVEEAKAHV